MSSLPAKRPGETGTVAVVRRLLLVILLVGILGTGAELLLLEHTEDFWQLVPVYLLAASLAVLGWHAVRRGAASVRAFQMTMILFVVSGVVGVLLHYRGNVEFELELHPAASGLELFAEAMKGATPALAPGAMIQLGLLGLAYTYRHPALAASTEATSTSREG